MPESNVEPTLTTGTVPGPSAGALADVRNGRRALLALAGITFLGALLRAWRINDFWLSSDEAIYYFSTLGDWVSARERIRVNAHPPLYYWILYGLAKFNGSIQFLRLTSLVSGVLCIPAMYLLGRSFAGRTAALCAAFLVALSPGAVFLSQVMRPYSMQLLFLALGLAGLARYLLTARTRWLVLHSGACLIATLLHYSTLIALAGVASCLAGLWLLRRLDAAAAWRLLLAELPVLAGAVVLYVTHIRPNLMGSELQANVRATWLSRGFLDSPLQLGGALADTFVYLFGRPTDLALFLALPLGLFACARARLWTPLLLACGTCAAALALSFLDLYPLLGRRHCLYLLVPLAPLAGVALEFLTSSRRPRARWAGALLAAVMVAGIAQSPRIVDRKWRGAERGTANAAAERIRATLDGEALAGAAILTDPATAVQLACLYREKQRDYVPIGSGPVYSLQAGGHRFYCLLEGYRLITEAGQRGAPGHLEVLLGELERLAEQGLVPALGERVWIVQYGSSQLAQNVLPLTLPDGSFLRSQRIGEFSFAVIQVDRQAYRRYLDG